MNSPTSFNYFLQAKRFLWAWSCSRSGLEASGCFSLWRIWSAGREQSSAALRYLWPACFCVLSSLSTNGKTEHAFKELQKGHWWTGWAAVIKCIKKSSSLLCYKECFSLLNEIARMKGCSQFHWKTALKYHTIKKKNTMLDCYKSNPWNPHCIKAFREGKYQPSSVPLIIVQLWTHVHTVVSSGNFLVVVMKLVLCSSQVGTYCGGANLDMTDLFV